MKKYVVKSISKTEHQVIEKSNEDQIIATKDNHRDARQLCNFLNGGGGFNGFTPSFFLKKEEKM